MTNREIIVRREEDMGFRFSGVSTALLSVCVRGQLSRKRGSIFDVVEGLHRVKIGRGIIVRESVKRASSLSSAISLHSSCPIMSCRR